MIRAIITIIVFFLCTSIAIVTYGQHFTVTNDKMNVMYIGVDNPITIMAEGHSCNDITVMMDSALIKPLGNCQYNINPKAEGYNNVKIIAKTKEGIKVVGTIKYRVKYLPDPQVKVDNYHPFSSCRQCRSLIADLSNFDFDARFIIDRYVVSILPKGARVVTFSTLNVGATFGKDVLQAIAKTKPGDKILFEEIEAHGPDNRQRHLSPITITLL